MRIGLAARWSLVIILFGCISFVGAGAYKDGKKAYEQGQYTTAAHLLMQHLRAKPKDKKAAELLSTVLPIAYKTHQATIQTAISAQDHDTLVTEYKALLVFRTRR